MVGIDAYHLLNLRSQCVLKKELLSHAVRLRSRVGADNCRYMSSSILCTAIVVREGLNDMQRDLQSEGHLGV